MTKRVMRGKDRYKILLCYDKIADRNKMKLVINSALLLVPHVWLRIDRETKELPLWSLFVVCSALSESLCGLYHLSLPDSGLLHTSHSIKTTNELYSLVNFLRKPFSFFK